MLADNILNLINQEIQWCENNPDGQSEEFRSAFIAGLKQSKTLIEQARKSLHPLNTRPRTHYEGCWQNHLECAVIRIEKLEKELASAQARSGAASSGVEYWKERAETAEADARVAVRLMEIVGHLQEGQILEPSDQIIARRLIAEYLKNQETLSNSIDNP